MDLSPYMQKFLSKLMCRHPNKQEEKVVTTGTIISDKVQLKSTDDSTKNSGPIVKVASYGYWKKMKDVNTNTIWWWNPSTDEVSSSRPEDTTYIYFAKKLFKRRLRVSSTSTEDIDSDTDTDSEICIVKDFGDWKKMKMVYSTKRGMEDKYYWWNDKTDEAQFESPFENRETRRET